MTVITLGASWGRWRGCRLAVQFRTTQEAASGSSNHRPQIQNNEFAAVWMTVWESAGLRDRRQRSLCVTPQKLNVSSDVWFTELSSVIIQDHGWTTDSWAQTCRPPPLLHMINTQTLRLSLLAWHHELEPVSFSPLTVGLFHSTPLVLAENDPSSLKPREAGSAGNIGSSNKDPFCRHSSFKAWKSWFW